MIITNSTIATLNPCANRHENYLQHYKGQDLSINDFIDAENLTYDDKIWVCRRLMTETQARSFAVLCAESVLHIFEARYPDNKALHTLLKYLKSIPDLGNLTGEQKSAIEPLKKECYAVADAAADAVADAAYDAAYAATATAARKQQQDLNLTYLKMAFSL